MNRWLLFGGLFLVTWLFLASYVGIGGGLLGTVLFAAALALTLDLAGFKMFPVRLKKTLQLPVLAILWILVAFYSGWLAGLGPIVPGAGIAPGGYVPPVGGDNCYASVTEELRGKAATIYFDAYDQESNTPFSAAVDLGSACFVVKKDGSVINTTDTSGGTLAGFVVGDSVSVYCAGTSYYTDPVLDFCIRSEAPKIELKTHTMVADTELDMIAYDDTGGTVLSAPGGGRDYYMTQGAGGEDDMYVKLTVNVANKAYYFGGWAVFEFYNISSVIPQHEEGTYTKVATPEHLSSVAVLENSTSTADTQTGDYSLYVIGTPKMLHEWDIVKEKFVVKADTSNDPVPYSTSGAGKLNGFTIMTEPYLPLSGLY